MVAAATRRRAFTVADQGASTLSNVLVTILAARALNPVEFGAFGVAVVGYQLAWGGTRAVIGESLLSVLSDKDAATRRRAVGDLVGASIFLGLVCAGLAAGVGWAVGGLPGEALLALAIWLPLAVLQDGWRFIFIIDRPGAALTIDLVWLSLVVVMATAVPENPSLTWFVHAWGLGGAISALVGVLLGWHPSIRPHPWRWLVEHRDTTSRFFGEFLTVQAGAHLAVVFTGAVAGLSAVGAIRAVQTFIGPINTLHGALYLVVVPEAARRKNNPDLFWRMVVIVSAIVGFVSVLWAGVGIAMPESLGRDLFGDTWPQAEDIMLPAGIALLGGSLLSGAFMGLRALGDARSSLSARLRSAPVAAVIPVLGAMVADAPGFAWGWAVGRAGEATVWWSTFHRSLANHTRGVEPPLVPLEVLDEDLLATVEMEVIR